MSTPQRPATRPTPALSLAALGRRERQIVEVLVRRGRATAAEVLADLPDPPTNATVRGMLRYLEKKGYARHEWDGPRHIWFPFGDLALAKESAVRQLIHSLFNGSMESALAAMLGSNRSLKAADLDALEALITQARARAKK